MSSKTDGARSANGGRSFGLAGVAVVGITVAIAAVLRVAGLGSGLWYDEIVTLIVSARLPIERILTEFPGVNAHPMYSVLAHASIETFGESAWALRLPACLFGIASVGMAFVLGARITSRVEAWAGSLVLATSYHHIWFSQNARGYTMLGFFTLVSTYCLLRAAEPGRRRDYVFYALACAAGVYTHLTMALIVAGQAAVLVGGRALGWRPALDRPLGPFIGACVGAALLSALAYTPFVPGLLAHFGADAPLPAAKVATGSWALAEAVRSLLSGSGVPAALTGGVVAAIGAFSLWRRQPLAVALLLMPAVATAGTVVLLGQPLRPRFFFFLSGAAAIFVGRGLGAIVSALAERRLRTAREAPVVGIAIGALALVAASAFALPRNYQVPKQDFDGAVRFLEREEAAGARIAAAGPACLPMASYFGKADWACLTSPGDLETFVAAPSRALVVYTLAEYIDDPVLRSRLRHDCRVVTRFPGTLGGGEMTVCDPRREESR